MIAAARRAIPSGLRLPLGAANALLAATLVALHVGASVGRETPFEGTRLASLPTEVAGWRGHEGQWDAETVTAIGAEDWLLREYEADSGDVVWLYVGFHGNASFAGSSPHSPLLCYPGQGWVVRESTVERIDLADGGSIPVNRLLVERGLEQRLVLYWLQWGDEVTTEGGAGDYLAKLRWLVGLPFRVRDDARTDRSLVRVSSRVGLSPDRTFAAQADFVRAVFPLLATHFALAPAASQPPVP